jgi:hypothetical protein
LYTRASEGSFRIRYLRDREWLNSELAAFGKVEQLKIVDDEDIYVLMETVDGARAACHC